MRTKKLLLIVVLLMFLFFSCKKTDINLEEVYNSLPDVEYVSNNYTVNGISFDGKMIFGPSSGREEKTPKYLKYKDNILDTIYNRYANSNLIMIAADTKICDICSIYEGQGDVGQLVFINGKLIKIEPYYSLIDFKIKDNHFIFVLADQISKKYVTYKP